MIWQKKKAMMMQSIQAPAELYPINTDIVALAKAENNFEYASISSSTGEYTTGGSYCACKTFVPVDPSYTYRKNGWRINCIYFYKSDYTYITYKSYNNTNTQTLDAFPSSAAYVRFGGFNSQSVSSAKVTRTA